MRTNQPAAEPEPEPEPVGMRAAAAIAQIRDIAGMDRTDDQKFRLVLAVLAETDAG